MRVWWFKTFFGIREGPRGTRAHWVNSWDFSITTQSNINNFGIEGLVVKVWWLKKFFGIRDGLRGTKYHWVNPQQFFLSLHIGYRSTGIYLFIKIIIRQDIFSQGELLSRFD